MLKKQSNMILVLLLFLHVNGLMAQTNQTATIDMSKKPVMCVFIEPRQFYDKGNPTLYPERIPCECEVAMYQFIILGNSSKISANKEVLKKLISLRPVIVIVERSYKDWGEVLKSGANEKDANVLIAFAKYYKILGYIFREINPSPFLNDVMNPDVTKNIIPYLKKIKYRTDFIVGVVIGSYGTLIKNPCVNDFAALNDVVDFYEIDTTNMNECNKLKPVNDVSPIKLVPHGNDYLYSMEEVIKFLKASKIDLGKVYLDAELYPKYSTGYTIYNTFNTVCTTDDLCTWCIPKTTDYFNKGHYIKQQQFGLIVNNLNCDDLKNACGCGPFIATRNILAGYHAEKVIACSKIDNIKMCPVKPQ